MIISHKHKFILIKPQKTAGTSVELMLSRICGPDDVITPLGYDPDSNVREKHNAKQPQNYHRPKPLKKWEVREIYWWIRRGRKPNLNFWEHLHADKIKEYVGKDIWNDYLKISIVRNPWDRAVSWFKWQEEYGYEGTEKGKFKRYLKENFRTSWPFYSINYGFYDVDFMIRFESLKEDLMDLRIKLDSLEVNSLPKTKSSIRKNESYRDFYSDNECVEIVREKSLRVIDKFNYDF